MLFSSSCFCDIWGCILRRRLERRFITHLFFFFMFIHRQLSLAVLRSLRLNTFARSASWVVFYFLFLFVTLWILMRHGLSIMV